jgi:hypothetical protein
MNMNIYVYFVHMYIYLCMLVHKHIYHFLDKLWELNQESGQ